jgi:hypothetical protein
VLALTKGEEAPRQGQQRIAGVGAKHPGDVLFGSMVFCAAAATMTTARCALLAKSIQWYACCFVFAVQGVPPHTQSLSIWWFAAAVVWMQWCVTSSSSQHPRTV